LPPTLMEPPARLDLAAAHRSSLSVTIADHGEHATPPKLS
jgi:hypothetical protein